MGAILVIVVVLVAFVKVPSETEFVLGKVTGVMSHATENGPLQEIGIVVEGQHRSASTRALLVHPATNDMICLRQTRYWPLGQLTYSMTDMRFCQDTIATSSDE